MNQGRIYKLLHAEYRELLISESLLVESPFAETTREGRGLREVALGLTRSNLIVASDRLDSRVFWCERHVDASIESLELKSVYPLEYVRLNVYRERKRKALEARSIDGRAKYYELGGLGCRARCWNEWCGHVRRLVSDDEKRSVRKQTCEGWTRKHLYLGPEYEELWDEHYSPKPVALARASLETVKNDLMNPRSTKPPPSRRKKLSCRVSRFAEGVNENCSHSLYIPVAQSSSESVVTSIQHDVCPNPHFLRGFGPWSIHPGDRVSLQSRLTQSLASIRRQEPEQRLPVSRRQLARATASMASLKMQVSTRSVVLFWTPDYWYRPRAAIEVYRDVRRHLDGFCRDRDERNHRQSTTAHLRKLLKLQHRVTLCDISSTTLSQQLTLVDRELFTRISINEIRNLAQHCVSRDASNFSAWVAFAHRVASLLESEVLRIARVEERSRIVARLIRTAERCVEDGNFQSASSVVAALQAPSVYRLKATWAYLRSRHSTKYNALAKLSKLFANTKSRQYREAWMTVESKRRTAMMPSVADVITRLLGLEDIERRLDGDLRILGIRLGCPKIRDPPPNQIDGLIAWLENCQSRAFDYNYPGDSLAWEFLLKARYREARENFLLSFYLEPGLNDG